MDLVSRNIFADPDATCSGLIKIVEHMGHEVFAHTNQQGVFGVLWINLTIILGPTGRYERINNISIDAPNIDATA